MDYDARVLERVKVSKMLQLESNPARQQCQRWLTHGFIERVKQGRYRKVVTTIAV